MGGAICKSPRVAEQPHGTPQVGRLGNLTSSIRVGCVGGLYLCFGSVEAELIDKFLCNKVGNFVFVDRVQ